MTTRNESDSSGLVVQEPTDGSTLVGSIVAAFVIRWTCGREDGVSLDLVDRFEGSFVRAHAASMPLEGGAPEQQLEYAVLSAVPRALRTAIPDLHDLLEESDTVQPLSLIAVSLSFNEPLDSLLTNSSVSWRRLSVITDLVLHIASRALKEWSLGRPMGPLSRGNLVGSGLLVPCGTDGTALISLPIFQHPDLGSWSPALPAPTESDSVLRALPANIRRLYMWSDRYDLRRARGEWSDAVVALQAAQEQFVHSLAQTLLSDHGWRRSDIEASNGSLSNHMQTLSLIQHHLGGDWKTVRSDQQVIWSARNAVIHGAEAVDEEGLKALSTKQQSFFELLQSRLSLAQIARTHPVTCTLFAHPHSFAVLGEGVVSYIMAELDRHSIEDTLDIVDHLNSPARLSDDPRSCEKSQIAWIHWRKASADEGR